MNKETHYMLTRLERVGISASDALALRHISMTLHRWHELECGTEHGCIERDEVTGKPYFVTPGSIVLRPWRWPVPDREAGARKRLAKILKSYPTLQAYVQTDPRGASLYILRPGDVPAGKPVDEYYSRGIAVYK